MISDDLFTRLGRFLEKHADTGISFGIRMAGHGDYIASAEWGREAEDSPMVAAAAYGLGGDVQGALSSMLDDAKA